MSRATKYIEQATMVNKSWAQIKQENNNAVLLGTVATAWNDLKRLFDVDQVLSFRGHNGKTKYVAIRSK